MSPDFQWREMQPRNEWSAILRWTVLTIKKAFKFAIWLTFQGDFKIFLLLCPDLSQTTNETKCTQDEPLGRIP